MKKMDKKEVNEKIDKIIKELVSVRRLNKQGEKPITDKPITKKELLEKIKKLFNLDKIEIMDDCIYVLSEYERHIFTDGELKPLFKLGIKYDFEISLHEKDNVFPTRIFLKLKDSYIKL